jgi:signal transduction histidine kinase/HAMP domain-containing protein
MLAGGLLGLYPAAFIGFCAGLVQTLWETHNPFTVLEITLLAILFTAAVRQRYRTAIYRLLRNPLGAAFAISAVYVLISMFTLPLAARGVLAARIDYTFNQLSSLWLTMTLELVIAGVFAAVIASALPTAWGSMEPLQPSPAETSLQMRFLYGIAPLALVLVVVLLFTTWVVAGNAARDLLRDQMKSAAEIAAEGVPAFLGNGQDLIRELAASPELLTEDQDALARNLEEKILSVTYFHQLYVLDRSGATLPGFPLTSYSQMTVEEQAGLQLAFNGIPAQAYATYPSGEANAAEISFFAAIKNADDEIERILIGRSRLADNPFAKPIVISLENINASQGQGILLDEYGRILYHPDPELILTPYTGTKPQEPGMIDDTAPDGTRQLLYFQPAEGQPWAILLTIPARRAQEIALQLASPLIWVLLILVIIGFVFLRWQVKLVTSSLVSLTGEASRLASGQLDQPLAISGADETAQLRAAFEKMRLSLKARLDELRLLLNVSQKVASSLELRESIQPALESALVTGATSARLVLLPGVLSDLDSATPASFSLAAGPAAELYSYLDDQVVALTRSQDQIQLINITRPRLLEFPGGAKRPESMMAIALRHENTNYGAFWVAYDEPHRFSEEESRFLATLAGQAALATANARLYMVSEIGRQRLAAILASTPDPVLVTDQSGRLLLANPAAWNVLGINSPNEEHPYIQDVLDNPELIEILNPSSVEKQPTEIILPGGDIYLATASAVIAEEQQVGRVAVLRDITRFKELDTMKSEFVATVSHDLRNPLQLMRGYATMLEMVGELNEQQVGYVRKIVNGVEDMTRLVTNLLDLGRIEAGVDLQLELVSIREIVDRVSNNLYQQAAQKHINISVEIAPQTVPLIEADQALLQQALHNLVDNAIKDTHADGQIKIKANSQRDVMIIEVQDNGLGISPMDQPHLFEKFYRSSQAGSKEQHGAGLGLAIVKSIVEKHGGNIRVESQLGKGSRFIATIPLRQPRRER